MAKMIGILIVIAGIWVGVEVFTKGPSQAFDGLFADALAEGEARPLDTRSTAQRSGDAVARAHAEAEARRERLLAE